MTTSHFVASLADSTTRLRRNKDAGFLIVLWTSLLLAIITLATLVINTLISGVGSLSPDFLTWFPSPFPEDSGIQSALFGSLWVTLTSGVVSLILALGTAIYLEEFTNPNSRLQRFITTNIQTLAGVPSIVYGILGLAFVVRGPLGWGFTVGSAAATLTMMVLPLMIVATREALKAVPSSLREGSYALGATRWQTVYRQVLPAARPGIATGSILGVSRALGESAPLILLGALAYVSYNPTGFDSDFTVLPLLIFKWSTEVQEEFRGLAAAAIIVLLLLLFAMNLVAIIIRDRSRIRW
ncbi:phosphate transport system permease protein PstA [Actinomycetes bacterium]|jgi:phosphate transport system permease protein|nr:phosphate transport system permease protein PstA [Actinomycetes bacterium]